MGKYGRTYHYPNGLSLAVEAKDGPWVIRWTDQGTGRSKRVSTRTTDRAAAEAFMTAFRAADLQQAAAASTITCGDIIDRYEAWMRRAGKHRSNFHITGTLLRFWRDVPLSGVNAVMQEQYETERRAGLHALCKVHRGSRFVVSDAALSREITALNAALNWAVKANLVNKGDAPPRLMPLPTSPRRPNTFTQADVEQLMTMAAATSEGKAQLTRVHKFVWLAILTGARCEALKTLRWDQIKGPAPARLPWTGSGPGWIDFRMHGRHATNKRRPLQPITARLMPLLERAYTERNTPYVIGGEIDWTWRTFRAGTPFAHVDLHRHDMRAMAITMALNKAMPPQKAAIFFGVSTAVIMAHYYRPDHTDVLDDADAYIN